MTTIHEEAMDEFFNFDAAAHPLAQHDFDFANLESGPYDIDLAFNEPENDEDSFTALQHFSAPEQQHFDLQHPVTDTTMMSPADFTDFQRWIEGMNVPTKPCAYCSRMRIHCKVIKEGVRKGSCTSCVALARTCSLTVPGPQLNNDDQDLDLGMDVAEYDGPDQWSESQLPQDYLDWNMEDTILPSDAPLASPRRPDSFHGSSRSSSKHVSLRSSDENINASLENNPKVGARFSREAIKVLRNWLSTHHSHPYPTDEEKESLRRQTGLNKTQITNWLANARRRGKVRPPRSVSPNVSNYVHGMDIPRRATPAFENMNPLERWKNSPPENEPAAITAIAKAVTSSTYSSGLDSPFSYGHSQTDDGSSRSLCNVSSTSSLGTSGSSGNSFASAFSHKSRGSFGSFGSFGQRGRRRRRRPAPKPVKVNPMIAPARTYQCTFCTETFKTKHDWQRHEKSLHLSLERWVCCPAGVTQYCADYGHNRCVFCGLPNPPEDHGEVHNYSSCAERSLEERTFYRKDHLRQHLNLVHDVKFQSFSMESWKVVTPEIRSRCGFCGIVLDTWSIRVDHLAEHFKGGNSMADWKGDWGFEPEILDIVENGMPPYLIHDERNSMNPYEASKEFAGDEKTLEDVVKIGLVEYLHDVLLKGGVPTDADLLREAREIVRKADQFTVGPTLPQVSWFRDLLMLHGCDNDTSCDGPENNLLSWGERLSRTTQLAPHDTTNLHTIACPKERALMTWVKSKVMLGLTPTDRELQVEATKILDDIENTSNFKAKGAVGWFKYLVRSDTIWLRDFRRRAGLPRSSEMAMEHIRSKDDKSIDYSILNFARLENELKDWCRFQLALGTTPSDSDIQRQARLIVYKNDDPWNQTSADDPAILHLFKRQNGLAPKDENGADTMDLPTLAESSDMPMNAPSPRTLHWDLEHTGIGIASPNSGPSSAIGGTFPPALTVDKPLHTLIQNQPSTNTNPVQPLKYFLNDANCYGRLVRELSRFVTSCMSPNNPMQHVPTDAEIQNQARWIIYDDDDPWNQTAADNAEWLIRFKRDSGLASPQDGPGLPLNIGSWREAEGGSGFSPPYLCPQNEPAAPYVEDVPVTMKHKTYNIKASTAQKYVKSVGQRYKKPPTIFCSREMESQLTDYARAEMSRGVTPSDEALRAKAREILRVDRTGADEPVLLQKFKVMVGISRNASPLASSLPPIDDALLAEFDDEIGNMDLSGIEMPGSVSPILDSIPAEVAARGPATSPMSTSSQGQHSPTKHSPSKGPGLAQDYAELYRVSAATASPLRRHASAKMASQAGYSFSPQPQNRSPLGISPPTTTSALSFPEDENSL
ncbi:uncharacterized protein LY89DRAFT_617031 [Mollisia scopiformis]|uniref:Monocarboxylate transporter 4 n=1 Tax=Mollisia scopiformis TaxID=149040 RepID=A0A194XAM4_MOLSC|nr:uncharacterized protein LY89DRAFT_617031 [Mollisia scopiformis]KUJ17218.1 hypothetical protein LY89DRAFT_617031 [Mollisia scopiformis]